MCKLEPGNMAGDTDIYSFPLALLPFKTRKQLSYLLNSTKIFPSDGTERLPRDWRGLASLINISSEVASNFHQYSDRTAKVLDIWLQDPTVTVGTLLEYMQRLDRYDVHDDILNDLREYFAREELVVNPSYQVVVNNNPLAPLDEEYSVITVDDQPGYEHHYHAFVLYAEADKAFVKELDAKLGSSFQICTKDKLLAGHATEYAPVAQLISQRCQYIILVYSPDFLMSPANTFYRDYAQAVSIESKQYSFQRKIIPIMYRECQLPVHLMFYHKLYYKKEERAMYNFWEKLRQSLGQTRVPRINGTTTPHSAVNIVELHNSNSVSSSSDNDNHFFLSPTDSRSTYSNGLNSSTTSKSQDDLSLSNYSSASNDSVKKKKKHSLFIWMFSRYKKPKAKKESQIAEIALN